MISRRQLRRRRSSNHQKLSPNCHRYYGDGEGSEAAGSDALSLINTLTGMKIDIKRRAFAVANKDGWCIRPGDPSDCSAYGISGGKCSIPSYHRYGGIATAEDALEFIMAGATAVSVGTANFFNPYATVEIADGIQAIS